MKSTGLGIDVLLEQMGPHAATALGLDLAQQGGPERWFVVACLIAGRAPEPLALRAARELTARGLDQPAAIAKAGADSVEAALACADYPRPAPVAQRLARAGRSLVEQHGGSLAALAAQAENLEELGSRLAALAPGVGAATVLRFLRPLRELWPAAAETPLDPAARAAAVHLGWLAEGEDEEGEPAALRAALLREPEAPPLADVEAALARLGARSCLRQRPDRCPLGARCPARR
jgi:endonuclease III